jgi:formamidopyrimidine-DNA glycosylase
MASFWMTLSGEGPVPVMHFGMNGMLQVSMMGCRAVRCTTLWTTCHFVGKGKAYVADPRPGADVVSAPTARATKDVAAKGMPSGPHTTHYDSQPLLNKHPLTRPSITNCQRPSPARAARPTNPRSALTLTPPADAPNQDPVNLAFLDSRRLARLRLVPPPVAAHPPVSQLGFDPMLSMPTLDEFVKLLARKKGTIKGVIMDQAFSAGVGNVSATTRISHVYVRQRCSLALMTRADVAVGSRRDPVPSAPPPSVPRPAPHPRRRRAAAPLDPARARGGRGC